MLVPPPKSLREGHFRCSREREAMRQQYEMNLEMSLSDNQEGEADKTSPDVRDNSQQDSVVRSQESSCSVCNCEDCECTEDTCDCLCNVSS